MYNKTYLLQCGPWVFGTCCSMENAGLLACQTAELTNLSSPYALDSLIEPKILSFVHLVAYLFIRIFFFELTK